MSDAKVEQALDDVLREGGLSEHRNYGGSDKIVSATELQSRVRDKVGDLDDLEARIEVAVTAAGGERLPVFDLAEKFKNIGRRLSGTAPTRADEMYMFPEADPSD